MPDAEHGSDEELELIKKNTSDGDDVIDGVDVEEPDDNDH